jgi:hypothetical protein
MRKKSCTHNQDQYIESVKTTRFEPAQLKLAQAQPRKRSPKLERLRD